MSNITDDSRLTRNIQSPSRQQLVQPLSSSNNNNERPKAISSNELTSSDDGERSVRISRSKSEPVLRPTRSMSSVSELTSDPDLLSEHSSDIESWDGSEADDIDVVIHSSTAHDDAAQLSPKVKLRERLPADKVNTFKKGGIGNTISGGTKEKDSSLSINTEKIISKNKKTSIFGLWQKRDGEDNKEIKHRKHASMIVTRTDSGNFQAPLFSASVVGKHRSASFEAELAPVLHKVNSMAITPVPADYSLKRTNTRLIVEEDGGKLVLTGGTVEQLICCLADRDIPDPAYLDEFFYSMCYFTTGKGLITQLRNRYEYLPPDDAAPDVVLEHDKWRLMIQQRVLNVMRYALDNHWYHFERDRELLPLMRDFVESAAVKSNTRAKALREAIGTRLEGKETQRTTSRRFNMSPTPPDPVTTPKSAASPNTSLDKSGEITSPNNAGSTDLATHGRSSSSPIIVWRRRDTVENNNNTSPVSLPPAHSHDDSIPTTPTSLTTVVTTNLPPPPKPLGKRFKDHRKVSFTRVHPVEMARQLTLIEKELFRAIRPPELVGASFKKKNKAEISPNVVQMIDWFNHITAWVQKELVLTPNLKERTSVLGNFIQVAGHLRDLGNFSGAMQIVCALGTASVKRLYKTWKGLTKKDAQLYASLEDSFSSKNNFANYRRISHETNGAVIPYVGIVLQDLLMIEELPTTITNGMINFRKMRRFATLLRSEIVERQATLSRIHFEPVHAIQEYLARRSALNEQDMYRYSRLCEPSKLI